MYWWVDTNPIIAPDAPAMLMHLGGAPVDTAASVADALTSIAANPPDFALLDPADARSAGRIIPLQWIGRRL